MEVSIVQIGNSKGIRLSKTIIEKYNLRDKVDLTLEKGQIIIKPLSRPRKGWDAAFKKMSEQGDDRLLFNDVFEDENLEERKKISIKSFLLTLTQRLVVRLKRPDHAL